MEHMKEKLTAPFSITLQSRVEFMYNKLLLYHSLNSKSLATQEMGSTALAASNAPRTHNRVLITPAKLT